MREKHDGLLSVNHADTGTMAMLRDWRSTVTESITLCVINVHVHMKIKSFSSRCKQSYVYIEYFLLVYLV